MSSVFDYLYWRGDLDFKNDPLNEVDNILFSLFSYLNFEGLVPENPQKAISLEKAVEGYFDIHDSDDYSLGKVLSDELLVLAKKMGESHRFGSLFLTGHVNVIRYDEGDVNHPAHWSATTFLLGDEALYIAFRGTDDYLSNWKEDFDMAVHFDIPSQKDATRYVNEVASLFPSRKIYVGGHSKGGNLAMYSAASCREDIKERIVTVFNNDGPGFAKEFLESKGYLEIKNRIVNFLPEQSVVGLLLENDAKRVIIKTTGKSINQHSCLKWKVYRTELVKAKELSREALFLQEMVREWLRVIPEKERENFFDAIYEIFMTSDVKTVSELLDTNKLELLSVYRNLKPENKKALHDTVKKMLVEGRSLYKKGFRQNVGLKLEKTKEVAKSTFENRKRSPSETFVTRVDGRKVFGKPVKKQNNK